MRLGLALSSLAMSGLAFSVAHERIPTLLRTAAVLASGLEEDGFPDGSPGRRFTGGLTTYNNRTVKRVHANPCDKIKILASL